MVHISSIAVLQNFMNKAATASLLLTISLFVIGAFLATQLVKTSAKMFCRLT